MNAPAWLLVFSWLSWDTFRQSLASRIFWLMLGVSVICTAFCLSISLDGLPTKEESPERLPASLSKEEAEKAAKEGVDVIKGEMSFLFGSVRIPHLKPREDAVRWVQLVLANFVADTLGLLLALIWTAAFLPAFLEPSSISVMLAKPVPRWSILAGKYVGVLAFVTFQATLFVVGTWLALAVRTGVWEMPYLWCVPMLVLHFAIFFSFSCMLAVWTRSTVVCVLGSLLFFVVCYGVNYGRHATLAEIAAKEQASAEGKEFSADIGKGASTSLEIGYWVLPKPADVGIALSKLLGANDYIAEVPAFRSVEKSGRLHLEGSLLASCLFGLLMLALAGYEFVKAEY